MDHTIWIIQFAIKKLIYIYIWENGKKNVCKYMKKKKDFILKKSEKFLQMARNIWVIKIVIFLFFFLIAYEDFFIVHVRIF